MYSRSKVNFLFFIKRSKLLRNGEAAIYLRIKVGASEAEISTLKSAKPEMWSSAKQGATGKSEEARDINRYLEHLKRQLMMFINEMRDEGKEITARALKNAMTGKSEEERSILSVFRNHNDGVKKLVGKDFAAATHQRYETCMMHIKDYIKEKYRANDLNLNRIDPDFIRGFELYLKSTRNCGHNSAMKYIKNFKKIVKIALGNGWMKNDPFVNIRFKLKKVERPFLTEEEISIIMNKDFHCDRLRQVADIFIFGCFTGYAYSDLKHLTTENMVRDENGQMWIHAKRQKTKMVSHVPLLPPAQKIILKYKRHPHCIKNNVLLPVLSNQKLNAYLKEVADLCGINKVLSTHIARHTFATTVTLNNDIPIESVSKMLGHSTITMTQNYAKMLDKKVGNDMKKVMDKFKPDSPPTPRELLQFSSN
jgi:site-specific recombinase XerD